MHPDVWTIVFRLLGVAVLVGLNGFFVAAEFALVKVRETQLDPLIAKGQRRARVAKKVVGNLDASLSACQLGITLASLGLGWIGEPVFAALLEPVMPLFLALLGPLMDWLHWEPAQLQHTLAFLVGFTAITFLHITAGEQAPKWLAIQKPLPTTLWVAQPLAWFHRASYPFIWALNRTSLWMLHRFGIEPAGEGETAHSQEELRLLFAAAQKQSGASALGRDIVLNALDLGRRITREAMTPRQQIVAFDTEASIAECMDVAEKSRYSRFPLCEEGDLDRTVGMVHIKDLYAMREKARSGADLQRVARKLIYLPEMARLEKLLQLFLERRLQMAIVVDEYGDTQGMVTLEDILEELVGQIQDEFDQEKPLVVKLSENSWIIDGALPLHELSELVGEPLHEEGITTTSGWVTHQLGGFPRAGDVLPSKKYQLRVEGMQGPLVAKLKLTLTPRPTETETG